MMMTFNLGVGQVGGFFFLAAGNWVGQGLGLWDYGIYDFMS